MAASARAPAPSARDDSIDMGDDNIDMEDDLTAQFWWGGQLGMARGAVWSRSLS
jgi:hypothetical protein